MCVIIISDPSSSELRNPNNNKILSRNTYHRKLIRREKML